MKRLFVMLAVAAAALLTVSCKKTGGTTPTGGEVVPTYKDAYYYGEGALKVAGSAVYRINLYDKNNPATTLRLDLVSDVAVSDNIKPAATTYSLGSQTEPQLNTFIVATSASDTYGTLYTDNGTPVLITAGTIKIQQGVGIQQVTATLTTETGATIEWTCKGSFSYFDEHIDLPRQEIKTDMWDIYYDGEYPYANDLGMIYFSVAPENMSSVLTLAITIPLPENSSQVTVPVGTFSASTRPSEANMIIGGSIEALNILYSREIFYNTSTQMMNGGTLIESGTITIAKNSDGTYTLTTDLSGKSFNNSGSITGNVDNIQYTLANVEMPEYIDDKTQPMSTLTEDVDLSAPMEFAFFDSLADPYLIQGTTTTNVLWRFVFSDGVQMSTNNDDYTSMGTLYISGTEGKAISIQLLAPAPDNLDDITVPVGTFPMNDEYIDLLYTSNPVAVVNAPATLSGNPNLTDPFALGVGTFYFVIGQIESNGQMLTSVVDGGGAVINKGQTTIKETGDGTYELSFEYYDKYGHKISGTQSFTTADAPVAQSVIRGTLQHNGYMYNPVFAAFSNSPFISVPAVATLK